MGLINRKGTPAVRGTKRARRGERSHKTKGQIIKPTGWSVKGFKEVLCVQRGGGSSNGGILGNGSSGVDIRPWPPEGKLNRKRKAYKGWLAARRENGGQEKQTLVSHEGRREGDANLLRPNKPRGVSKRDHNRNEKHKGLPKRFSWGGVPTSTLGPGEV